MEIENLNKLKLDQSLNFKVKENEFREFMMEKESELIITQRNLMSIQKDFEEAQQEISQVTLDYENKIRKMS